MGHIKDYHALSFRGIPDVQHKLGAVAEWKKWCLINNVQSMWICKNVNISLEIVLGLFEKQIPAI